MPPIMIAVGAGLLIFAIFVVIGLTMSRGEQAIDKRLQTYAGQHVQDKTGEEGDGKKPSFFLQAVDKAAAKRGFASSMAVELARADLKLTVGEYLILNWVSVISFGLLMFLLGGTIFVAPIGMVIGYFVPRILVKMRKGRRLRAFNDQLGDCITLMANALRAGYSLLQAMEVGVTRTGAANLQRVRSSGERGWLGFEPRSCYEASTGSHSERRPGPHDYCDQRTARGWWKPVRDLGYHWPHYSRAGPYPGRNTSAHGAGHDVRIRDLFPPNRPDADSVFDQPASTLAPCSKSRAGGSCWRSWR